MTSGSRVCTLHIPRPQPTVSNFNARVDHERFRFKADIEKNIRGIKRLEPLTAQNISSILQKWCRNSPSTWSMVRKSKYGANATFWLPTRPPCFYLRDESGQTVAEVHHPPLLPIPQADSMSVSAFLNAISPAVQSPVTFATAAVFSLASVPPLSGEGEASETTTTETTNPICQLAPDVGVIVVTREELTCFVARAYHDHYYFTQSPVRLLCDDPCAPPQTTGDDMMTTHAAPQDNVHAAVERFVDVLTTSQVMQSASTWWYRTDYDVGNLVKQSLARRQSDGSSTMRLDDERWTMLPRTKLLKNVKWNVDPETLALEMKYGLLEGFV